MRRLLQLLAISAALHSAFLTGTSAAQCNPVAYLFRHAEDVNMDKSRPFVVTLTESGLAHAQLYIEMLNKFQQENSTNCPIREVYALNPKNFDGSIGTSNPYWTAEPLAQTAQTTVAESTESTNAVITVEGLKLTEYLDHNEAGPFLAAIKDTLSQYQSVAIFWTSQGMCKVATTVGLPGLPGYNCGQCSPLPDCATKPARNSVFQLSYSVSGGIFTNVTEYAQCFNYNASSDSFANGTYYCQYSYNLNDWDYPDQGNYPGFWNKLQNISGRICNKNNPQAPCVK